MDKNGRVVELSREYNSGLIRLVKPPPVQPQSDQVVLCLVGVISKSRSKMAEGLIRSAVDFY